MPLLMMTMRLCQHVEGTWKDREYIYCARTRYRRYYIRNLLTCASGAYIEWDSHTYMRGGILTRDICRGMVDVCGGAKGVDPDCRNLSSRISWLRITWPHVIQIRIRDTS